MLLNLWDWQEQSDGSLRAERHGTILTMDRVWDPMYHRDGWEYRYFRPDGTNGGGMANSAHVEEAKREAERMASWVPCRG